ncbi:uncharacterized protein SCHCODRAFT_02370304 [Schizophyllum commune H4-8]|uniref:uncharacterized protein n=1 Tax=Schizophyllum commune (strain H4-8 / FGSC 9210) TaxID=578458 RepID=UPI00215FA1BE|nr:uncharacterized protein SCHCODRAFT_02370304 [Schizophyllum commune H4-8]KAI5889547.1 hypothetical protein SCHCODRAFT_02370304 [Schizophyllum commune H4-8]
MPPGAGEYPVKMQPRARDLANAIYRRLVERSAPEGERGGDGESRARGRAALPAWEEVAFDARSRSDCGADACAWDNVAQTFAAAHSTPKASAGDLSQTRKQVGSPVEIKCPMTAERITVI